MQANYKKFLWLVKGGVSLLLAYVLFAKFSSLKNLPNSWILLQQAIHIGNKNWFFFLVFLMPINWLLEIMKWNLLLKNAHPISFSTSIKSVLGGLSIGIATPARVGEFAGRVLFLKEGAKISGVYLSALGGIAQTIATILVAIFSIFYLQEKGFFFISKGSNWLLILCSLFLFFFYFLFEKIVTHPFLQKKMPVSFVVNSEIMPSFSTKLNIFILSFFRYAIYLLQYYFAFQLVGLQNIWQLVFAVTALLLLVQSFSPFIPLLDLPFRSSLLVLVFGYLDKTNINLAFVPLILWFVNLLIPALIGYIFVIQLKNDVRKNG